MAVEVTGSSDRQIVTVGWDKSLLDGELVQLYCVNPDNGDISNSGLSANDGSGQISYPQGYSGTTEVTVYDNHGNADFGIVTVGEDGEIVPPDPPVYPTHPIVLPPDSPLEPTHPIELPPEGEVDPPVPTHPIVLPPLGIWPSPPEGQAPIVDHELPEIPGLPSHPIVFPPEVTPH
jgi:hypothetical protein